MELIETNFKGVFVIDVNVYNDNRGWFIKTFDSMIFSQEIPDGNIQWKQINQSFSKFRNTFRGFHFQEPPFMESKLVRCLSGSVLDFGLDLRKDSDTFLQIFQIELSSDNKKAVFLPKGFAHGFITLEDNTELLYLHDENYYPEYECGIKYNDSQIKNLMKFVPSVISDKDKCYKEINQNFKGY